MRDLQYEYIRKRRDVQYTKRNLQYEYIRKRRDLQYTKRNLPGGKIYSTRGGIYSREGGIHKTEVECLHIRRKDFTVQ